VAVWATQPGVQLRVTQNGLNYAKFAAMPIIQQEIHKAQIPTVSGRKSILEYSLSSIKIPVFSINPVDAGIILVPGKGVTITAKNVAAEVTMNWEGGIKAGFIHITKSGSVRAQVSGISFAIEADMAATADGKLKISTRNCNVHIDHVSIHISGDVLDEIANMLDPIIDEVVKKEVGGAVCQQIDNLVRTSLADALNKFAVKGSIMLNFMIDYGLTGNPTFTPDFGQLNFKGELFIAGNENIPVPAPVPAQYESPEGAMVSVAFTDFVFNAIAYTIQSTGFLSLPLSPAMLSKVLGPEIAVFFQTTCSAPQLCVGSLIPQIGQKFPNSSTTITFTSLSAPKIHTSPAGIVANLNASFAIQVDNDPSGLPAVTMTLSQDIRLNGLRLLEVAEMPVVNGSVNVGNYVVNLVQQSGDLKITQKELGNFVESIAKNLINLQLNDRFQKGVKIPKQIPYVDLYGTQVDYYESTLVFSSKLKYKGGLPI
jgi:hypothetical protein